MNTNVDKPCPDCKKESPNDPSRWQSRYVTRTGYRQGYCKGHLYARQRSAHSTLTPGEVGARRTFDNAFNEHGQVLCLGCQEPWNQSWLCPKCEAISIAALTCRSSTALARIGLAMDKLDYWSRLQEMDEQIALHRQWAKDHPAPDQGQEDPWAAWERGEAKLGPPPENWRPPEETEAEDPAAALAEFVVPYEDGKKDPRQPS